MYKIPSVSDKITMTTETVKTAQYKMNCFCCNCDIKKGASITRVIENTGMELRRTRDNVRPTYTNARWVHAWCLPRYNYTEHFYDTICSVITECEDEEDAIELIEMIRNHKYWKDEI